VARRQLRLGANFSVGAKNRFKNSPLYLSSNWWKFFVFSAILTSCFLLAYCGFQVKHITMRQYQCSNYSITTYTLPYLCLNLLTIRWSKRQTTSTFTQDFCIVQTQPFGQCYLGTLIRLLKITEEAQIFGLLFPRKLY
jgi:hypothetical protein